MTNVSAATCFFDYQNSSCLSFATAFNDFDLAFDPSGDLEYYEASIFNKDNPNNIILSVQEGNKVKQINPFTEPGVYTLRVEGYNKAQVPTIKEFDFVFDNKLDIIKKFKSNPFVITDTSIQIKYPYYYEINFPESVEIDTQEDLEKVKSLNFNYWWNRIYWLSLSKKNY